MTNFNSVQTPIPLQVQQEINKLRTQQKDFIDVFGWIFDGNTHDGAARIVSFYYESLVTIEEKKQYLIDLERLFEGEIFFETRYIWQLSGNFYSGQWLAYNVGYNDYRLNDYDGADLLTQNEFEKLVDMSPFTEYMFDKKFIS
ncbi:hypothetical protein [Companilactobacillus mishanensis]|uniref:Uncharacterized protein n=1 Tax=Companilactobacillus mishanensis TaxID=2486008 RepID=A0A5P0ZF13_9LACO|nr:hypothetical protein [Companilactobacillus mishanensis]MQS44261.1 hypothetical protein [Companilactobacillus mishanensis]MQS51636.1 hypothetical protein [Companilactobacillus mishanensis]